MSHSHKYHATSNVFRCNCGKIVKKENSKCDWDTEALDKDLRLGSIEFKNGSHITSVWHDANTISGVTTTAIYTTMPNEEDKMSELPRRILENFFKKIFFGILFLIGCVLTTYGLLLYFKVI